MSTLKTGALRGTSGTADSATLHATDQSVSFLGHVYPDADNTKDLGSSSKRWANVYVGDMQLSNEGASNDVDGTWGSYTLQEGADDLFLINNRTGKKYKFKITEVS